MFNFLLSSTSFAENIKLEPFGIKIGGELENIITSIRASDEEYMTSDFILIDDEKKNNDFVEYYVVRTKVEKKIINIGANSNALDEAACKELGERYHDALSIKYGQFLVQNFNLNSLYKKNNLNLSSNSRFRNSESYRISIRCVPKKSVGAHILKINYLDINERKKAYENYENSKLPDVSNM